MSAPCHDCSRDTSPRGAGPSEYYAVHDDVWSDAGGSKASEGPVRFLCIGCLEQRLGRTLTPADFRDAPINHPGHEGDDQYYFSWRTDRLLNRLGVTDAVPRRAASA